MGKAMLSMIGVLYQVERDLLAERIRTALAVKKLAALQTNSSWKSGRPLKITPELESKILKLSNQGLSTRKIAKLLDIGKSGVHRVLSQNRRP
jgi:DNA invertase Pin-like site-specific DNA recombinase